MCSSLTKHAKLWLDLQNHKRRKYIQRCHSTPVLILENFKTFIDSFWGLEEDTFLNNLCWNLYVCDF